jgi:hypothetical protein
MQGFPMINLGQVISFTQISGARSIWKTKAGLILGA